MSALRAEMRVGDGTGWKAIQEFFCWSPGEEGVMTGCEGSVETYRSKRKIER